MSRRVGFNQTAADRLGPVWGRRTGFVVVGGAVHVG